MKIVLYFLALEPLSTISLIAWFLLRKSDAITTCRLYKVQLLCDNAYNGWSVKQVSETGGLELESAGNFPQFRWPAYEIMIKGHKIASSPKVLNLHPPHKFFSC